MNTIEFVPLTKHEQLNGFFKNLNDYINKIIDDNISNPYISKMVDLYKEGDYFKFFNYVSEYTTYLAQIDANLVLYTTLYLTVQNKLFGLFHGYFNYYREALKDNENKEILLTNFFAIFASNYISMTEEEFVEFSKEEYKTYNDIVNILRTCTDAVEQGKLPLSYFNKLIEFVFADPNFHLNEKTICLIFAEGLYEKFKEEKKATVTLNYGVDENNHVITWYKDLSLENIPLFNKYFIRETVNGNDKLDQNSKRILDSFFIFEFTLRLDNYLIKPLNNDDQSNIDLFNGIISFAAHYINSLNPEVCKDFPTFELDDAYKTVLSSDIDTFIADKSLIIS